MEENRSEYEEDLRLLGLKDNFDLNELKKAFKLNAKVWHPDRFQHDEELFKEASEKLAHINNAYQRLKQHIKSGSSFITEEECEAEEPHEAEEEVIVEEQEKVERPEKQTESNEENLTPDNSQLRARKYKTYKSFTVFFMIGAFALIGLSILDYNSDLLPEGWLISYITDGRVYLTFFVAGVISYNLMRKHSDKPEKYY